MIKKTDYTRYLKVPQAHGYIGTYEVNKTHPIVCTNNVKPIKALWYGYETIGPRLYALYSCPCHGKKYRVRI